MLKERGKMQVALDKDGTYAGFQRALEQILRNDTIKGLLVLWPCHPRFNNPRRNGGAETLSELLKIDPKVKAVVSSGYSNDPVMSNYEDYGFCGVVPKPYTKDQLAEVLNQFFPEKDQ